MRSSKAIREQVQTWRNRAQWALSEPRTEAGRELLRDAGRTKGIEAEASERSAGADPIDVEALKRAVEIVGGRSFDLRASDWDIEQVAAEYARLLDAAPSPSADSWRDTGNRGAAEHASRLAVPPTDGEAAE